METPKLHKNVYDFIIRHTQVKFTEEHHIGTTDDDEDYELFLLKTTANKIIIVTRNVDEHGDWFWQYLKDIERDALNGDKIAKDRFELVQCFINEQDLYDNNTKKVGNVCNKCNHPIKERILFNSTFVGCMC